MSSIAPKHRGEVAPGFTPRGLCGPHVRTRRALDCETAPRAFTRRGQETRRMPLSGAKQTCYCLQLGKISYILRKTCSTPELFGEQSALARMEPSVLPSLRRL
jgi:hypothetical protein